MTWQTFLSFFAIGILLWLLLYSRAFHGRWKSLARTVTAVTAALVAYDSGAEQLLLWRFPSLSGIKAAEVPLENILFSALICVSIVLLDESLSQLSQKRKE